MGARKGERKEKGRKGREGEYKRGIQERWNAVVEDNVEEIYNWYITFYNLLVLNKMSRNLTLMGMLDPDRIRFSRLADIAPNMKAYTSRNRVGVRRLTGL